MKRIWFGLGYSLALSVSPVIAQDSVPAASLGKPAASLGRPVSNDALSTVMPSVDVRPAAAAIDFIPKNMPKGTVTEAPMLPMPGPMVPMPGSVATPTPMPGGINSPMPAITSGPVMMMPGQGMPVQVLPGQTMTGPIPSGPMMVQPPMMGGPVVAAPMPGCDSPYGCGVPGISGITSMPMPVNRWYTSAEYLLWWMKGYIAPPLATVGPVASQGILGRPGVSTIFPTENLDNNPISGFRVGLGYWFSPKWAIEANFFQIRSDSDTFSASSNQYPNLILGRPFFSLNQNAQFVEQIGNPGIYAGSIDISHRSTLWGLDLNLRKHLYQSCNYNFDLIAGFRMLDLGEDLVISEASTGLAGAPRQFVGQSRALTDSFKTKNQFYGGQFGGIFDYRWGKWSFNAQAKVALGSTLMTSTIAGGITAGSGAAPTSPGGLLALDTNISSVTESRLSFVPEVNLNLGYDITSHTRIFVGYSFLYWSTVARPGSQIDQRLNEYHIPDFTIGRNPPQTSASGPMNVIGRENFWAQGVNIGLQFRW